MEKIMDDFLRPYPLRKIMELHSLTLEMVRYGLTAEEVLAACTTRIEEHLAAAPVSTPAEPPRPATVCPECGAAVRVAPVNVSKCTNVGGSWKTSLECINKNCRFTELSVKSMNEWSER